MAATVYFDLPTLVDPADPFSVIQWFQKTVDAVTWPTDPVDTLLVSNLFYDSFYNKYSWTSPLANQGYVSSLYAVTASGIPTTITYETETLIDLRKIEATEDPYYMYEVGQYVDLTLELDPTIIGALGTGINVQILDPFGNIIETIIANRIEGTPLFTALYRIPLSLGKKYNPTGQYDVNTYAYRLRDKWLFLDQTFVEFEFLVSKTKTSPIKNNSEIYISLEQGIISEDMSPVEPTTIAFSTKLDPFYCTVEEVMDISQLNLKGTLDNMSVARTIVGIGEYVDAHIRPDPKYVYYVDRFQKAISSYVKYYSAYELLGTFASITSDEKSLDTFRVAKTTNAKVLMDYINGCIEQFGKIIYAGGKDTPYAAHTFIKGIADPNRPNIARANMDSNDPWPFVNATSKAFVYEDANGNTVEARGARTIVYRYPSRVALDHIDAADNIWGKIK